MTRFNQPIPILNVNNFAEAIDYYINKLGFKKNWDWGDPPSFGSVCRDQTEIFLCQGGQGKRGMWMWIGVENVDNLHNEYKEKGVVILEPPANYPWGSREMLVEDLDGHRFRLASESTGPPDYPHLDTARASHETGAADFTPLPITARLTQYERLAERLFTDCKAGNADTIGLLRDRPHLIKLPVPDITSHEFALSDAQLIVARRYQFESWRRLAEWVEAVSTENSAVWQFENAVEAEISGDAERLRELLSTNPDLVRARSMRTHEATLLLYMGSNGVEGHRQKTPKNAVEITKILLDAGSDVNAIGKMYSRSTTLELVATSLHPFVAGVQNDLIDLLIEHGALIEETRSPDYVPGSLVGACLDNGRPEAAEHLAKRGATLDFRAAAGVGRLDIVKQYYDNAGHPKPELPKEQIDQAFITACNCGRVEVVDFLLDHGADIAASNGQTGFHLAAHAGKVEMVKHLIELKAPLEIVNEYGGTVLGQAIWSAYNAPRPEHLEIIDLLIAAGAEVGPKREKWIAELRRRYRPANYSELVQDVLAAYNTDDVGAMKRLNNYTGQNGTTDRLRKMIQHGLCIPADRELTLEEAQMFVARAHDSSSWEALIEKSKASEGEKKS